MPTITVLKEMGDIPTKIKEKNISLGGELHSGIRYKDTNKIFLVDYKNFYLVNFDTLSIDPINNTNCQGLFLSDNNYMYTLSHKSQDRSSGFILYDIQNCIEKNVTVNYHLSNIQVGCQGLIDFSHRS
jgi:hypothetical protein